MPSPSPTLDPKGQHGQMREGYAFFTEFCVLSLSTTETPHMQLPESRDASLSGGHSGPNTPELWGRLPNSPVTLPVAPARTECTDLQTEATD